VTRHLTVEQALRIARVAFGGPPDVRDMGLLESAVHRPRANVLGQDAYPDLLTKAAALMHSPARNHTLVDGNKRLAWLATSQLGPAHVGSHRRRVTRRPRRAISAASLAELHFGVLVARDADERARRVQRLGVIEATFDPLPIDAAVAREWGRLAADGERVPARRPAEHARASERERI
jgi:hypothetical protein